MATLAFMLGSYGCAGAGAGINSTAIIVESEIRALLEAGEISAALTRAVSYERRSPGPLSWGLLGRALWRSGELLEAESYHRRAARSGAAEGLLGQARAAAARGRLEAARLLAEQAMADDPTRARALRLLAAIGWVQGDSAIAADYLSAAAEASDDDATRAYLETRAAVAATVPSNPGETPILWSGAGGTLPLERGAAGEPIVVARMGDTTARLRLSLSSSHSTLSPRLVGRVGLVVHGSPDAGGVAVTPVALGRLSAPAIPFVLEPVEGADGELGFDVLSTFGWELWLRDERMVVSRPTQATASTIARPRSNESAEQVYWIEVRMPVDGLQTQLLLLPRLSTVSVAAALDLGGASRISYGGLALATVHDPEPTARRAEASVVLSTRLGGFRTEHAYRIEPRFETLVGSGLVTPQSVLGADFARSWGLRWSPKQRQLVLLGLDDSTR